MDVKLKLIEEEKPFLVAGFSTLAKGWVFGFPYFAKKSSNSELCAVTPCIILPTMVDSQVLSPSLGYDIGFRKGEFHPVHGSFRRFVEERDGKYIFEDDIIFNI